MHKLSSISYSYRILIMGVLLFFVFFYLLIVFANRNQAHIRTIEKERYAFAVQSFYFLGAINNALEDARRYVLTNKPVYKDNFAKVKQVLTPMLKKPLEIFETRGNDLTSKIYQIRSTKIKFSQYEISQIRMASRNAITLLDSLESAINLKNNNKTISETFFDQKYPAMEIDVIEPIRKLHISLSLRTAQELIRGEKKQKIILLFFESTILLYLILCLLIYRYSKYRIVEPISELSQQAKKLSQGNYLVRNNIQSQNELETLGKILNQTVVAWEKDIKEREKLNSLLANSEERFRSAIEFAPIGIAIHNLDGEVIQINKSMIQILGLTQAEVEKVRIKTLFHEDDAKQLESYSKKLIKREIFSFQHEARLVDNDEQIIWVLIRSSLLLDSRKNPINIISLITDITNRKQHEFAMKKLNKQMSATLEELQTRENENIILNKMNEMLLTSHSLNEAKSIIEMSAPKLFPYFSGALSLFDKKTHVFVPLCKWGDDISLNNNFDLNDCWALRNGHEYNFDPSHKHVPCKHFSKTPVQSYIDYPLIVQGEAIGLLSIMSRGQESITQKTKQLILTFSENIKLALANIYLREALRDQAIRDSLTGLFNRRYLDETLPRELEKMQRDHSQIALAMIDVDNFKKVNDAYGHEAGDKILKLIGKILIKSTRKSDVACRYGGDEFIILFVNTNIEKISKRVEGIRKKVHKLGINQNNDTLSEISLSIGIAKAPKHGKHADKLLNMADKALYRAKKAGKNQIYILD